MANELRVRTNFAGGLVEDNPLSSTATTLTSAGLASLPAITSTQHTVLIIDPDAVGGNPEIVYVTAHTALATTATIVRGQEGTIAREHLRDTPWVHGPTIYDFRSVLARQGGSSTVWGTNGTTNYVPTGGFAQVGQVALGAASETTSSVAVTFPISYAAAPIVIVSFGDPTGTGRIVVRADSVTASGFTFVGDVFNTGVWTAKGRWMAVGE
jgi:hypothetical protein